jgi:hypothetical protein
MLIPRLEKAPKLCGATSSSTLTHYSTMLRPLKVMIVSSFTFFPTLATSCPRCSFQSSVRLSMSAILPLWSIPDVTLDIIMR